jgi:hypothetical protein
MVELNQAAAINPATGASVHGPGANKESQSFIEHFKLQIA